MTTGFCSHSAVLYVLCIEGQVYVVHLVRLLTDNFSSSTNGQTTTFRLHNVQIVNRLMKIAWASVLHLKQQHTSIYSICTHMWCHVKRKVENLEAPVIFFNQTNGNYMCIYIYIHI